MADGARELRYGLEGLSITQPVAVPPAPEGYQRDTIDSYAVDLPRDAAASVMMNGAFTKAVYRAGARGQPTYNLSISDLTAEFGPLEADKLLSEIAETGGERELRGGRVHRRVIEDGERFVVTEFETNAVPARRFAHAEWVIARRYKVVAEAEGLGLDELMRWAEQVDFAALEARAKAGKPIE
ncbi:MAG: hypothetical protein AB1730_02060 [Myxococcota bacterium]